MLLFKMRFGVSPLSLEFMINRVIKKQGVEGLSKFRLSELVEEIAKEGFKHCEISLDLFQILPIQITDEEIEKLKKIKQRYNVSYSAHLPFSSIELACPNKFIREASIRSIIDAYESFINLEDDIEMYVLHPTGEFITDAMNLLTDPVISPIVRNIFTETAIQSVKEIISKTGIDRNKIAIETIEFPLEATIKIVNELDTKLCIDTAHLLGGFSGDYDLLEIAAEYLDITGEIHLQDYNDENVLADHCALGMGKNFPPEFLNLIHQKDFKGPIVFELPRKDIITSIEYIKNNAHQIQVPNIEKKPFL
jgi:sugar phosphate isomerase/epimerase